MNQIFNVKRIMGVASDEILDTPEIATVHHELISVQGVNMMVNKVLFRGVEYNLVDVMRVTAMKSIALTVMLHIDEDNALVFDLFTDFFPKE